MAFSAIRRFILLSFLGILLSEASYSQELDTSPIKHDQDVEFWTSLEISKRYFKDLTFSVRQGYRADENFTRSKSWLTDLEATYKLSKVVRLSGLYRYAFDEFESSSRIQTELILRKKVKRFTASLRSRVQRRFRSDANHDDFLREKFKLEYNIKKNPLNPYVASEWFYHIHYRGNQWETYRLDAGVEWSVGKRKDLLLYYRNEREFNVAQPELSHIIGVHFKYRLK